MDQDIRLFFEMLRTGTDPHMIDEEGCNALSYPHDSLPIISILLGLGVNWRMVSNQGETLFFFALDDDNLRLLKVWIKLGLDPNHQNCHGQTVLHRAAEHSNQDAMVLLVKNGADPTIKDNFGKTSIEVFKECSSDDEYYQLLMAFNRLARYLTL